VVNEQGWWGDHSRGDWWVLREKEYGRELLREKKGTLNVRGRGDMIA